ncbi:hypothetical protein B0T20DRAFT_348026 [Sordaria brevicollis]|uniref:Uncharacterized protein n=1 Tax=Sordaria brevicollis TaxID=83679 RepID=A0AAE0PJ69_SORBR|nr:hypothetical protein B0T20DRAFT_348026 [Sordaria brevicollis]
MEAMASTEADSRMKDFDLQGIHQIIAISQDEINSHLSSRFHPEVQDELLSINHEVRDSGIQFSAKIGPPTVEVCTDNTTDTTSSWFYLDVERGYFKRVSTTGPGEQVLLKGLRIQFRVNYGEGMMHDLLDPNDPHAQQRQESLQPGRYSLSRVLLALASARCSDIIQLQLAPSPGAANRVGSIPLSLEEYLKQTWMTQLKELPHALTLGYTIQQEEPNPTTAPTVPPTAVRVQNYRYQHCRDIPEEANETPAPAGSRNALLFLEMTGGESFPRAGFTEQGNILTGDMPAALALSRTHFLREYIAGGVFSDVHVFFLELLNDLMKIVGGQRNKEWVLTDQPKEEVLPNATWTINDSEAKLSWRGGESFRGLYLSMWKTSSLDVHFTTSPRTNKIILTSKMKLESGSTTSSSHGPLINAKSGEAQLTLEFTMLVAEDGALIVRGPEEKTDSVSATDTLDSNLISLLTQLFGSDSHGDAVKSELQDALREKHIGNAIAAHIKQKKRVVLPGSGTFSFRDPVFSDKGDLHVTLGLLVRPIKRLGSDPYAHLELYDPTGMYFG